MVNSCPAPEDSSPLPPRLHQWNAGHIRSVVQKPPKEDDTLVVGNLVDSHVVSKDPSSTDEGKAIRPTTALPNSARYDSSSSSSSSPSPPTGGKRDTSTWTS